MSLYGNAVLAIVSERQQKQAALDAAAASARAANVAATRAALQNLVPETDPFRPVAELLAATLSIGRESDGFPERTVSQEATQAYCAAVRVLVGSYLPKERTGGLLDVVSTHVGEYGIGLDLDRVAVAARSADYAAWDAARNFRAAQIDLS